jgi:hypothetical protein
MIAALADRFVAQLTPTAIDVLVLLCHNAPQVPYEDLQAQAQAQLGISRAQIGGVLTSLAAGRKRLPREVEYPIKRDAQHRRYRIEPFAAELLLSAIDAPTAPGRLENGPSRCGVQWFGLMLAGPVVKLAIPLAIRSLSRCWPGCDQADGGPDATCGDAPWEYQPDGGVSHFLSVGCRFESCRGRANPPVSAFRPRPCLL